MEALCGHGLGQELILILILPSDLFDLGPCEELECWVQMQRGALQGEDEELRLLG